MPPDSTALDRQPQTADLVLLAGQPEKLPRSRQRLRPNSSSGVLAWERGILHGLGPPICAGPAGRGGPKSGGRKLQWSGPEGCWLSDDRALIDVAWVHRWLSQEAYWAKGRPYPVVARSIANSLVFGLYTKDRSQVGFARFVTDYATFGWLCDVFVDPAHSGRGLGSFLVETAVAHPAVAAVRQVLAATPGRTLYARQGFAPLASPERWMERDRVALPVAGSQPSGS